jgi:cellobiose phosphorylase
MVAGRDAVRHGEAKNAWLTGTAAWCYVTVTQHLVRILPEFEGLSVNPRMGSSVGEFTAHRRCRGAEYEIHVVHRGTGPARLVVDGKPINGTIVPYAPAGAHVRVECVVG